VYRYWDGVCQTPTICCMRTTYERLNQEPARALRDLLSTWLPRAIPVGDAPVEAAVKKHAPLHRWTGAGQAQDEWPLQLDFEIPSGHSFRHVKPQLIEAAREAGRLWLGGSVP